MLALLNRPRLVILDELTQGLDPAARRNVWAAVRQLHDEGTTVLLVTHEMDEAEALCGRVVVMRGGPRARRGGAGGPGGPARRDGDDPLQPAGRPGAAAGPGRRLDGVHEVERTGRAGHRARRTGASSRTSARRWCGWGSVPADLSVHVPTLEDALLGLLDGPSRRTEPLRAQRNW